MDNLVQAIRMTLGVPFMLTIGQYALHSSEDANTTFAFNVHTKNMVFTAHELLNVSDEELLIKCLKK